MHRTCDYLTAKEHCYCPLAAVPPLRIDSCVSYGDSTPVNGPPFRFQLGRCRVTLLMWCAQCMYNKARLSHNVCRNLLTHSDWRSLCCHTFLLVITIFAYLSFISLSALHYITAPHLLLWRRNRMQCVCVCACMSVMCVIVCISVLLNTLTRQGWCRGRSSYWYSVGVWEDHLTYYEVVTKAILGSDESVMKVRMLNLVTRLTVLILLYAL